MPFLWGTVAKEGQIYGNRALGSHVSVTNGFNISYPGYSETLTGLADERIRSNDQNPNPNTTVFEWLNRLPEFRGRVAAFGAWDTFSSIFNAPRCGFPVNSGYAPFKLMPNNATIDSLNREKRIGPKQWEEEPLDKLPFGTALEYMKERKPRALFIGLGETDDWAHSGDYPDYLGAAHAADQYLRILWETVQSMPEYRNSTTIILTADHGRGNGAKWSDHGAGIPESSETWFAVIGPDTAALGERSDSTEITQTQFAATLAALLGEDFQTSEPRAGAPINDVLGGFANERQRLARNANLLTAAYTLEQQSQHK